MTYYEDLPGIAAWIREKIQRTEAALSDHKERLPRITDATARAGTLQSIENLEGQRSAYRCTLQHLTGELW